MVVCPHFPSAISRLVHSPDAAGSTALHAGKEAGELHARACTATQVRKCTGEGMRTYSLACENHELPFFFHLLQPGAHILFVLLVEMSEEQAAADLLFFRPEDAPQILDILLRKSIESL